MAVTLTKTLSPCFSSPCNLSRLQSTATLGSLHPPRMVRKVVRHDARNEVIAVVIPRMPPQRQRVARRSAGLFQQLGAQLLAQEFIGLALVHEDGQALRCSSHQPHRVPFLPR